MPPVEFEPTVTHYQLLFCMSSSMQGLLRFLGKGPSRCRRRRREARSNAMLTWEAKSSDAPDYYEVALTDAGVTALKALRSTFSHIGRVDRDN